jgi:hypothetical protein
MNARYFCHRFTDRFDREFIKPHRSVVSTGGRAAPYQQDDEVILTAQ